MKCCRMRTLKLFYTWVCIYQTPPIHQVTKNVLLKTKQKIKIFLVVQLQTYGSFGRFRTLNIVSRNAIRVLFAWIWNWTIWNLLYNMPVVKINYTDCSLRYKSENSFLFENNRAQSFLRLKWSLSLIEHKQSYIYFLTYFTLKYFSYLLIQSYQEFQNQAYSLF